MKFLVAILTGLKHFQEINFSAYPLDLSQRWHKLRDDLTEQTTAKQAGDYFAALPNLLEQTLKKVK